MNYRIIGDDGNVYDVPEENVPDALNYGTFYDSFDDFNLVNPATKQTIRAPKKEVQKFVSEGFKLDPFNIGSVKMVDSNTFEVFDVSQDNVKQAWLSGGRPSRSFREPVTSNDSSVTMRMDNTGENQRLSTKKNFWDAIRNVGENPSSYVPFLNALDVFDSVKIMQASKAVRNNTATPEQRNLVTRATADAQRGTSWGYKVADMALRIPAFAIEYFTGGKILKGLSKAGIKKAAQVALNNQGKEVAARFAAQVGAPIADDAAFRSIDDVVNAIVKDSTRNPEKVKDALVDRLIKTGGIDTASLTGAPKFLSWLVAPADETVGAVGSQMLKAGKATVDKTGKVVQPAKSVGELMTEFGPQMGQALGEQLKQAAASGLVRTAVGTPHRAINSTIVNMTPTFGLTPDQRNGMELVLTDEGDGFGEAFIKGFADTAIENFSESVGANFIFLRATAGKAAKEYLKAATLATSMDKIALKVAEKMPNQVNALGKARKMVSEYLLGSDGKSGFIQKMGWNGYFAELGEEAVGGALRQAFGISPVGLPSVEDVSAMAVAFLVNPMALAASAHNSVVQKAAEAEAKSAVDLEKMLQAATDQAGILTAEQNTLRKTLEESVKTLADKPRGIFGKVMYNLWTAPVENRKIEAIYNQVAPEEGGKKFYEKAGLATVGTVIPESTPTKQVFSAYLNQMAENLSLADQASREQVNSDQVDFLLRGLGVYAARQGTEAAAVEQLVEMSTAGEVSLAAEAERNALRLKLKPGTVLNSQEYRSIRNAFPYLYSEVNISELRKEGASDEEIALLLKEEPIFKLTAADSINNRNDLVFNLLYKGSKTVKTPEWEPSMKDIRTVASIFGFIENIDREVKLGATESQVREAFNRRIEPVVNTIRNATQNFGQTVNVGLGKIVSGMGRDLMNEEIQETFGLTRDIGAYGRSFDPDVEYAISRYGSYNAESNGKEIFVSVENLLSPEGPPVLIEESGHALTMDSDGKLFRNLTAENGLIPRMVDTLRAALAQGGLQKQIRDSLGRVLAIADASPHEFLIKYQKAEAGVISPTTQEDIDFSNVSYLYQLTEEDYLDIGRALVAMGRGGKGTKGIEEAKAIKLAADNYRKLFVEGAAGISGITMEDLGAPPAAAAPAPAPAKKKGEKIEKVKKAAVTPPSKQAAEGEITDFVEGEKGTPEEFKKLRALYVKLAKGLGSAKPTEEEDKLRKKFPKTAKKIQKEEIRKAAGKTASASRVMQSRTAQTKREAVIKFLDRTADLAEQENINVNIGALTPEQVSTFANLIAETPEILGEAETEELNAQRRALLRRFRRVQNARLREEARKFGFKITSDENKDAFEAGTLTEEEEGEEDFELDVLNPGADENAFGNSLLAKLVSLFPEGREKERDIVEFFGQSKLLQKALAREDLVTENDWAAYLEDRTTWTYEIANEDVRRETARMLKTGELTVEDLKALAGLRSVRYVQPMVLRADGMDLSFDPLPGNEMSVIQRRAASSLAKLDTEKKVVSLLERIDSAIEDYEKEKELNKKSEVKSVNQLATLSKASAFEKSTVRILNDFFGVSPLFGWSGMFYPNALNYPASITSNRRSNLITFLVEMEKILTKGLTEQQPPAKITSDLWNSFTRQRTEKIPSFAYQLVSPANRQTILLSKEEATRLKRRFSIPLRYRNTVSKLINSATRTNSIMRTLEKLGIEYSTLAGGFAEKAGAGVMGYSRKALTDKEIGRASYRSWLDAVKKGGGKYQLPFGVAASKEPLLLLEMDTVSGATWGELVNSLKKSKSYKEALTQIEELRALNANPSVWLPDLTAIDWLAALKEPSGKDYRALFDLQETLDRFYVRNQAIISPVELTTEFLRKRKKKTVETEEDQLLLLEEMINESKRSSSFMTPQVGIPPDIAGGFGKTMRVLLLEDPKYQSLMFPGSTGDRTDGWALWTDKGVEKLRNSLGSVFSSGTTKGLHAGRNLLFKESQAELSPLVDGLVEELGAEAENHALVALLRAIEAMPEADRPDIIRFTSAAKLGGKELALRDLWNYTDSNSVRLKPGTIFSADQVFEVETEDFGLVGKADKDPVTNYEPVPTQWLPSNLGTSGLMSKEFAEFAAQAMDRNLNPERVEAMARKLQSTNPEDLLSLIGDSEFFPQIKRKLLEKIPLSVLEMRQLSVMIGSQISDDAGKIKLNRSSSVNTPSFSYEYEGTAPEIPVRTETGEWVTKTSRIRANMENARYDRTLERGYKSEDDAIAAAIMEILGKKRENSVYSGISFFRDMLTVHRKTDTETPPDLNTAYKQAVRAIVDMAIMENNPETGLIKAIRANLEMDRMPSGTRVRRLMETMSSRSLIEATRGMLELHELDLSFNDMGEWTVTIPGSLVMAMRVPSPGQPAQFVARLKGQVGDGSTNQMIFHPDDSARAGADFDIDTWYHFGPEKQRGNPGIGNDFIANWLIRLSQGMMRDEAGHRERYTKTNPEAYRDYAREKLKDKLASIKRPYYSWDTQGKLRADNMSVKKTVGIFAASQRLINSLRVRKLSLSQFGERTSPQQLSRFEIKFKAESGKMYTFVLGNVSEISPAAVDHFNTMLQMAVDNDKLLYLPAMGVNESNAGFITTMFLFNPDLMRFNPAKPVTAQDFTNYLDMLLDYIANEPSARYFFTEKAETKTPSYFALKGRTKIKKKEDPLFRTGSWRLFSILKHLSDAIYKMGQVQNISFRPPSTYFNHLRRKSMYNELMDPTGYRIVRKGGKLTVSVDTRSSLVEDVNTGLVSSLFGRPEEMNELYERVQFAQEPVASLVAQAYVRSTTGETSDRLAREAEEIKEKIEPTVPTTNAEKALKDRNVEYDAALQKNMEKVILNIFAVESINDQNYTITREPSKDTEKVHLNTRLIERTRELQQAFPENEFLRSIDAADSSGVGPAIIRTLSANLDPTDDAFTAIRKSAESLPEDYMRDMLVYSKLRWGNATTSRNGNVDALIPDRYQGEFAQKTIEELARWNSMPSMAQDLSEKYYKWSVEALASGFIAPLFSDGPTAILPIRVNKQPPTAVPQASATVEEAPTDASSSALRNIVAAASISAAAITAPSNLRTITDRLKSPTEIVAEDLLRTEINDRDMQNWASRVRAVESYRSEVYPDTRGKMTVGYGFNMSDRNDAFEKTRFNNITGKNFDEVFEGKALLTPEEAETLLQADLKTHFQKAENLYATAKVPFAEWPIEVKLTAADMAYVGALPSFKKTHGALLNGDFKTASREVVDTKYLNSWVAKNGPLETANKLTSPTVVRYRRSKDVFARYYGILQDRQVPPYTDPVQAAAMLASDYRRLDEMGLETIQWPENYQMGQRRDLTTLQFERSEKMPFRTQVLRAFLTREKPDEPYFSKETIADLRRFMKKYNSEIDTMSREKLSEILEQEFKIPEDLAELISSMTNLPFDGTKGNAFVPKPTVDLNDRIEEQSLAESPYLRDVETKARRLVERNDIVSSSAVINSAMSQFGREFNIYNRTFEVMNQVRMFKERTEKYIFQVDEYFGLTGPRIRRLQEQKIFGVDEQGNIIVKETRMGIGKPLGPSRFVEIKGPRGEFTPEDREAIKKFHWALGALGSHRFLPIKEGGAGFSVADLIIAFHEEKTGDGETFKRMSRGQEAARAAVKKIGSKLWRDLTPSQKAERIRVSGNEITAIDALGYNEFIKRALNDGVIVTGGAEKVWNEEKKEYETEGQTVPILDYINDWDSSDAKKKLLEAGRIPAMLQVNVNGKKGFRALPWLEKQLVIFKNEAEEMNGLFEEITGEPLFYQRFGYLMPQIGGAGWLSIEAEDWLERRTAEIRDTAKNDQRFIQDGFSEARYDYTVNKADEDKAKPTQAQKEFFKKLTKKDLESKNFIAADVEIYNALREKLYSETRPAAGQPFKKLLTKEEEGLLDHFNKNILMQPAFRDVAASTKKREYDTWLERFKETGETPKSMSPFDMLEAYSMDMHNGLQSRAVLANAALTTDMDGRPSAFIALSDTYDVNRADAPIPRVVLVEMVRNMGQYLYREEGTKEFLYNPRKDLVKQIRAIADHINRNAIPTNQIRLFRKAPKVGGSGYVRMVKKIYRGVEAVYSDSGLNADMMKKIADLPLEMPYTFLERRRDALRGLADFTVMQKIARVSFSLFFPLAAVESQVGYYGQFSEVFRNPKGLFGKGFTRGNTFYMGLIQLKNSLFNGHDPVFNKWLQEITSAGLMVDVTHDYDAPIRQLDAVLERMQKRAGRISRKALKYSFIGVEKVIRSQRNYSNWLFGSIFPMLKVHAAHLLSTRALQAYQDLYGRDWTNKEKMETYAAIARALNNGFGGQNWGMYPWATPRMLQGFGLSFFAFNWTLSTANTMGANILLEKMGLGPKVSDFEKQQMIIVNTLIFSLALTLWPNILQAALYAVTRPFGDDEDEEAAKLDVPFAAQNEQGRRFHVDATPLLRLMPWFEGGKTGERRYFLRWGKQIYEVVDGWLTNPIGTLLAKTSMPVQMALTQATGESPGSDFPMPFKDQNFMGFFTTPEEGFAGSRVANILSYNLPFSVPSLVKDNFDAFIFPLFATVSKGKSAGAATRELERVFRTYAMPNSWNGVSKNPTARENLRALGIGIIEAAERNGFPSDKIINSARGPVLGDLYLKMFEELDKNPESPDQEKLNTLAKAILRVNGTADGMQAHIDSKEKNFGNKVELTPEQEKALNEAFTN